MDDPTNLRLSIFLTFSVQRLDLVGIRRFGEARSCSWCPSADRSPKWLQAAPECQQSSPGGHIRTAGFHDCDPFCSIAHRLGL